MFCIFNLEGPDPASFYFWYLDLCEDFWSTADLHDLNQHFLHCPISETLRKSIYKTLHVLCFLPLFQILRFGPTIAGSPRKFLSALISRKGTGTTTKKLLPYYSYYTYYAIMYLLCMQESVAEGIDFFGSWQKNEKIAHLFHPNTQK